MNINFNLLQIPQVAQQIIEEASNKILLFYGDMGIGKTTLIKEIIKQLGVDDTVSSPTFSLVNEYLSDTGETIYHFDFYRIDNEEEALDIGIEEYFDGNFWCFIEWPEKVKNIVPLEAIKISLSLNEDGSRKLEVRS